MELTPPILRRVLRGVWILAAVLAVMDLGLVVLLMQAAPDSVPPRHRERVAEDPPDEGLKVVRPPRELADYAALWQHDVSADFRPVPPPAKPEETPPPPEHELDLAAVLLARDRPLAVLRLDERRLLTLEVGAEREDLHLLEVGPHFARVLYAGKELRLELARRELPARLREAADTSPFTSVFTGKATRPRTLKVDTTTLRKLAATVRETLLDEVTFEPAWVAAGGTALTGLLVLGVDEPSLWYDADVRPGDLLIAVGGKPLGELADLARLYDLLVSDRAFALELERGSDVYGLLVPTGGQSPLVPR